MLVVKGTGSLFHVLGHVMTRIALQVVAVWRGWDYVWRTIHVLRYLGLCPLLILIEVLHVQLCRKLEALGAKVV